MLKIRLGQRGKKGQRFYQIVVVDSHNSRDTKDYLAVLGY
jgi:ribosomal protein S16